MGTSRTPAEFAAKVATLPSVVIETERAAVRANAKIATDNAMSQLRRHVGSARLANVGKKGARLSARSRIDGASGRSADIRALGPWQLVENDTGKVPYAVTSRHAAGSRKTRARAALAGTYATTGTRRFTIRWGVFSGGQQVDTIRIRGTRRVGGRRAMLATPWGWRATAKVRRARRGKRPWRTAYELTRRQAPQVYQRAANQALRKALR